MNNYLGVEGGGGAWWPGHTRSLQTKRSYFVDRIYMIYLSVVWLLMNV